MEDQSDWYYKSFSTRDELVTLLFGVFTRLKNTCRRCAQPESIRNLLFPESFHFVCNDEIRQYLADITVVWEISCLSRMTIILSKCFSCFKLNK
jgi:hypothetical protein